MRAEWNDNDNKKKLSKTDKEMYVWFKSRLQNLQRRKKVYYIVPAVSASMVTGLVSILLVLSWYGSDINSREFIIPIIVAITIGIITELIVFVYFDWLENYYYDKISDYDARNERGKVQEDIFENSIKMSYKYLDEYYAQTRDQARKGFIITFCVAIFGALLVGFGILMMFLEKTNPSYITCASGVITEFIAAIFFYLYNKTITSMSNYHNKLVLSHNISIALRVADSLPEMDKVQTKDEIIKELLKDINSHLVVSDSESTKGSQV